MNKIKVGYLMTTCKNAGPINQTLNIIKNFDKSFFEPVIITLFEETNDSLLNKFLDENIEHVYLKSNKFESVFLKNKIINKIDQLELDIIHSIGMLPFKISNKSKKHKSITTIRNYFFEDYPAKYGRILGKLMAFNDLNFIKNKKEYVTCSESLSSIYFKKHKLKIPFIRNGVDIEKFNKEENKKYTELKNKYGISKTKIVLIYTGQFIDRKNQELLIQALEKDNNNSFHLLLLGKGPNLDKLAEKYRESDYISFVGQVEDVKEYLDVADIYVSTSLSEGLPNGVLEAMACNLPVVLSDIEQHKEIFEVNNEIGYLFETDNKEDLLEKIKKINKINMKTYGMNSRETVVESFSDMKMSREYQQLYKKVFLNE